LEKRAANKQNGKKVEKGAGFGDNGAGFAPLAGA
jgi:hypothetical protein